MIKYAADFETSVESDVMYHMSHGDSKWARVYLWCMQELFTDKDKIRTIKKGNETTAEIKNKPTIIGYDINSFMNYLRDLKTNCCVYFHNLKFDGEYIKSWLKENKFEFIDLYNILSKDFPDEIEYDLSDLKFSECYTKYYKSRKKPNTYEYLITNTGIWHHLTVNFGSHTITFRDSLKLFNTRLENLLNAHDTYNKIGVQKTKLDVQKQRAPDYKVTNEELVRCMNDTIGLAYVLGLHKLDKNFEGYLSANTIGGCAMSRFIDCLATYQDYKNSDKNEAYRAVFPELSDGIDEFIRNSYRGGWSYVNPIHANKTLQNIEVYDANSMYPTVMANDKMPLGRPIAKREYDSDDFSLVDLYEDLRVTPDDTFYVIEFDAVFIVKPDGLPFIVDSNKILSSAIYFDHNTLTLPEPLFILFNENYNFIITSPTIKVIMFRAVKGYFKDYISSLYDKKQYYAQQKNIVLKDVYKLLMNSLYGKFGQKRKVYHKIEIDNETKNTEIPEKTRYKRDYTPIATAITGYAKLRLTRLARSFGDRFVYTDTDSIHILKGDLGALKKEIDKDNSGKLGLWKLEHTFSKAKYLHSKCYIGIENNQLITTIAGLRKQINPVLEDGTPLTFDNFKIGAEIKGNLKPIKVPGGVFLKETPFKIREMPAYSTDEDLINIIKLGGFDDPYYYSDEFIFKYSYKG